MSKTSPADMAKLIGQGLLCFPVTHFNQDYSFCEKAYSEHFSWMLQHEVAAVFAAGGTGEFSSLTPGEVEQVCKAAVVEANNRVPVIAAAGYGTAIAVDMAKAAERARADGILLLPPYLMTPSQEGLIRHIIAVCRATPLGVIVYNRDNAVLNEDSLARLCDTCPNLVGFKDGVGNIELMTRIYTKIGDRLTFIGGLPTAEMFALPYLEMGVTTYSSAIFNFMPSWALEFYRAVRAKDRARIIAEIDRFVAPYINIRNRGRGYAVSIVKAGMTAIEPARPARCVRRWWISRKMSLKSSRH